jgi:hypothetical protein
MRKRTVIGGVIFLVLGASLFIYATYVSPPLRTVFDDYNVIQANWYWRFENGVQSGVQVCSEYSTSDEVEFFIVDSENFELFLKKYKEGEKYTVFNAIYHAVGTSDSYTFRAPRGDTYYAILMNAGDTPVSASFKQTEEMYYVVGGIGMVSLVFLPIGFILLIVGLVQKPKTAKPPKTTEHNETSLMHEKGP